MIVLSPLKDAVGGSLNMRIETQACATGMSNRIPRAIMNFVNFTLFKTGNAGGQWLYRPRDPRTPRRQNRL